MCEAVFAEKGARRPPLPETTSRGLCELVADIDFWRGREHALYLFMNNDAELHQPILDELIFPYIMGEFLAQFLPRSRWGPSV